MISFTRSGIAGTLLALLVALVCVRLGFWQLDRLETRRARNAAIQARLTAQPVVLDGGVSDTAGLLFRRVAVAGEYDHAHSVVLGNRTFQGSPGVHVLTPLRLTRGGGRAVLVNRGWAPSPDAATVDLTRFEPPDAQRIEGFALPLSPEPAKGGGTAPGGAVAATTTAGSGRAVYSLAPSKLAARVPYPLLDFYVQESAVVEESEPASEESSAPAGLPVRLPAPALGEGPHLGYAVQWFSFAAIALLGWAGLMARRAGRAERRDTA